MRLGKVGIFFNSFKTTLFVGELRFGKMGLNVFLLIAITKRLGLRVSNR